MSAPTEPTNFGFLDRDAALRVFATQAVFSMPPERQAVLVLAIDSRLSYREIAQQLVITEQATLTHMREGLALIKDQLSAEASTTEAVGVDRQRRPDLRRRIAAHWPYDHHR